MAKPAPRVNLFYVVLLVVGALFCLTAMAYGVMAFRATRPVAAADETHPLFQFLQQYGVMLLLGELAILAVCTVGAIGIDAYRSGREKQSP